MALLKVATVLSSANDPSVVKHFKEMIINFPFDNSEQDGKLGDDASTSQGHIIECCLIKQSRDGNSVVEQRTRIHLSNEDINYNSPLALANSFSKMR